MLSGVILTSKEHLLVQGEPVCMEEDTNYWGEGYVCCISPLVALLGISKTGCRNSKKLAGLSMDLQVLGLWLLHNFPESEALQFV